MEGKLIENAKILNHILPINTTGASQTGTWFKMNHYRFAELCIMTGAWAGGSAAVTLNQATSSAGANSKALAFTTYYTYTNTSDTVTKNTASSNTFNVSAANTAYIIPINSYDLDLANLFNWVQVATASPGSNADLIACVVVAYQHGYAADPTTLPSALT